MGHDNTRVGRGARGPSHGCPTRILDWTRSAYVALYFAVVEESEKDGAIWAIHPQTVQRWMNTNYQNYSPPTGFDDESEHYLNPQA